MADTPDYFGNAMQSNDQMIGALQQANAAYKPQGIFANVDPTMLSLAQGLLAPTKTGGFGESISNAAGAVAGPLAQMKATQLTNLEKIAALKNAQARLAMEAPYYQARGDYYGAKADATGGTGDTTGVDFSTPLKEQQTLNNQQKYEGQLRALQGADNPDPVAIDRLAQIIDKRKSLIDQHYGVTPRSSATPPAPAPTPDQSSPGIIDTVSNWWNGTPPKAPAASGAPAPTAPSAPKQPAQQPATPDTTEAPIAGATKQIKIGKDNMTATYAPDGKWYVVKDGKYHPVE
jgi:hypothetical protein